MNIGDYIDYEGTEHRCVRYAAQSTLHRTPEGEYYILREKFYELKCTQTGRLHFVVEEQVAVPFAGATKEGDRTASILPKEAIPREGV
jgi:hypothetical protein